MYIFGLSPIRTPLLSSFANIVMESALFGILKKKAVALEIVAAKEMEQLGIAPVGSHEDESETQAGESVAQASPTDTTGGATPSKEPIVREEDSESEDELPLDRKRWRVEKPLRSATSAVQASERMDTASQRGKAPSVEALSSDRTPSQLDAPATPIEAVPVSSLPPASRRVLRSGILSIMSSPASDPLASAQTTPGRRRTIRVTLHLSIEAFMAESDRPTAPEYMITMKGALAEMWADARARVAMIPLDKLANSHMQQSTGRWVEEIVVSNRLAMVEEELKRLKSQGGPSSSRGPSYAELQKEFTKTKDLLEAERKKTADQAYMLDQLNKHVKSYDHKIELATTRKNTAIADLEKKNVEARALEQRVNELAELLEGEQKGRSEEVTKLKDDVKGLQEALDASRATFKEYQEAEPGRVATLRQKYIRSAKFVEKVCDWLVIAFELAITATTAIDSALGQDQWATFINVTNGKHMTRSIII
ncbi:uncharacterized protein LOC122026118 [Zingiber officinale]|uniref:uncharacterized protein LOC122026118 n=1 Tax=Zingiber officinale TaxID=94328 RepID=UPI001C4C59B1|nr:uncharacterized protein LOC122026118 [Zingiber officinale]